MITLENYYMGRKEDPKYKDEWNQSIEDNAMILLEKVNALLNDLAVHDCHVSSGWRPPSYNATVPNAAAHSNHEIGKAIDIYDPGHKLYDQILARNDLLKLYKLFMEDKGSTVDWCHLDFAERSERPINTFKP